MSSVPKNSRKRLRVWALLLCAVPLGCGFRSEVGALERLRSRIQRELGTEASVNVHSAYGATTVTIRLAHLPAGDSMRVQQQVEALTKAEFPETDYVVVLPRP